MRGSYLEKKYLKKEQISLFRKKKKNIFQWANVLGKAVLF